MVMYVTDEVVFEVPDGFVDESMTMLTSTRQNQPMSIVVSREPVKKPLQEHVTDQLATIQTVAPNTRVLGVRDREVGMLPAREAKLATFASKQPLYVRQTYVDYYGTYLSFSVSSQRPHQQLCDATAERLLGGTKFRKR